MPLKIPAGFEKYVKVAEGGGSKVALKLLSIVLIILGAYLVAA